MLLLDALRAKVGAKAFAEMMDSFGRANAGKEVTTAMFRSHAEKATGHKLGDFFDGWLNKVGLPDAVKSQGGPFSVLSFYEEVEETLIVYGTADDLAANRVDGQSAFVQQNLQYLKVGRAKIGIRDAFGGHGLNCSICLNQNEPDMNARARGSSGLRHGYILTSRDYWRKEPDRLCLSCRPL